MASPMTDHATAVAKVVAKTREIAGGYAERLGPDESPLSKNRVTGWSLNFPIYRTCAPTKVCAVTCYFTNGPLRLDSNLKRQLRVYNSTVADPIGTGDLILREYDRKGLTFLRWNGGGDLFAESVAMLNHCQRARPDHVYWVVTRRADMLAGIEPSPNTYIHFSLDRSSLDRREKAIAAGAGLNLFFSYQAAPGEHPDDAAMDGISVLFFDDYKPGGGSLLPLPLATCPLNRPGSIVGACETCRRCFDGSAVAWGTVSE